MQVVTENSKNLFYYLLYGVLYLHALLPLRVLYLLSDILYFFAYRIVRYRKRVVRKNLKNSFPAKTDSERKQMEKKFYHHLCDYFVETIKLLNMSEKEIRKRFVFRNPEIVNRLTQDGNSCLLSLGHYANWEWVPSIGLYLSPTLVLGHVYKRLRSQVFDRLFIKIRSSFLPKPIEMRNVYRTIVRNKRAGKTMVIGFLSDQRPSKYMDEYWTTFLNQDTLVQTGMERIARQFGFSVVYLDIKKVKRGYYVGNFSVITTDASLEEEFVVMEKYMRKLEETIFDEPAYYLWSHNKWIFHKKTPEN